MKNDTIFKESKKKHLHEKVFKIHGNLWKVYFALVLIGIIFISIKGLINA